MVSTGAEIPLSPVGQPMVRQLVALKPMEVHGAANIHLQVLENPQLKLEEAQMKL